MCSSDLAALGQRDGEVGGYGGFADAALARGDGDDGFDIGQQHRLVARAALAVGVAVPMVVGMAVAALMMRSF